MTKTILSVLCLLACTGLALSATTTTVVVSDKVGSAPIPPNFAGFSFEVAEGKRMVGQHPDPPKTSWTNLVHNLCVTPDAPGTILRIGGSSVEGSWWDPDGKKNPPGVGYDITDVDLFSVDNSVKLYNGSWVFGANFRDPTSAYMAVDLVNGISQYTGWSHVKAIEIGNEVDAFNRNGLRPTNYTYDDYEREFKFYADAVYSQTKMPSKNIQGAVFCCGNWYTDAPDYMKDNVALLKTMSFHSYPQEVCNGHTASLDSLLADHAAAGIASNLAKYFALGKSLGLEFYLGETNSVACGGAHNISDVIGAALWSVDYMFNLAKVGCSGVNYHGGPRGIYSAVNYNGDDYSIPDIRPLYYAMWIFATTTSHYSEIMETEVKADDPMVKVWAVKNDGHYKVVVIHKNYKGDETTVTVTPPGATRTESANLKVLEGKDGVFSEYGINYAGQTFDGSKDGKPIGTSKPISVKPSDGKYVFTVKPATIAVLEM